MNKAFITLFTLSLTLCINAQTFEWVKSFGSNFDDDGRSITIDTSGNVYTTGSFQGTVDFDPGVGSAYLSSVSGYDIFVQKLDASGNFIWAKSFGGNLHDFGNFITLDDSGNVYTTGHFQNTVDFDPGIGISNLTSAGGFDSYVQKLDPSGNLVWAKSFGGNSNDFVNSIFVDASGNVYTAGNFMGTCDFDPGPGIINLTSSNTFDAFVQKLDVSGNFIWVKSFGGNISEFVNSITVDSSGNIYTIGVFHFTVDFDPGAGTAYLTSVGGYDIFVLKLDNSGNFIWAKSFGGSLNDSGNFISLDDSGNVYTSGCFQSTVDFDPGTGIANLTSIDSFDIFVQKLDDSGNFIWAKSFGGSTNFFAESIDVDASGNVYTTGNFNGTGDFNPGTGTAYHTSAGGYDIFVQKLDATGNFVWAKSFGGSLNDNALSIEVDAFGNVYTIGNFQGIVDFDPGISINNLTSAGIYDVFIQKLNHCLPNAVTDVQTACDSYTWIDGITYTNSNNTATWSLTNTAGCDSVVTLDLTIFNSNTGTDIHNACNSYTWIDGNDYTSSNSTETWTLTNIAGCDSIVTLNLTINSVSDITISSNGLTIMATNSNATYQWLDCENNKSVIVGETNQTFTATVNGNYAVELTENGCKDTSDCITTTNVGVLENTFNQEIKLFPNPTVGAFTIDLGSEYEITKITIRDAIGRLVSYSSQASIIHHFLLDVPAGIYFIEMESDDKVANLKLIIQ